MNAWRAGCFVEDMGGDAKVFLEKDGVKKEVQPIKRVQGGRELIWLEEIAKTQPQQPTQEPKGDDEPTQEEDPSIQEVDPEETRTQHTAWLEERVTAPEKEKGGDGNGPP